MSSTKYIFVTGGVVSSLGKGLASASLACLLEARGVKVTLLKLDPYINIDPGTMNPYQHGEVYVTADGAETDLDLGHYERFCSVTLSQLNNLTAGRIYHSVITKERKGEYLGKTVQVVPHITNEIKGAIVRVSRGTNVVIVEIGGTVGDIESLPFLEAIRQFRYDVGQENVLYIHLTLVPYIAAAGELKTKPTQHSVKELMEIGIQPQILLCRTDRYLSPELKSKIALFCNVREESVITAKDVDCIYNVPLVLQKEKLDELIVRKLGLKAQPADMSPWKKLSDKVHSLKKEVNIALVGKYVNLQDSYKSLTEAMIHGGIANDARINFQLVEADDLDKESELPASIRKADGLLIPGGFGHRGIEGKIRAVQYARENKIPFLGICLGMHCAAIEFARNVCKIEDANSSEVDPTAGNPIIDLLPDQHDINKLGGTMRLGQYPCKLDKQSLAYKIYRKTQIKERHRHRYEFNNQYRDRLVEAGLAVSGYSPDRHLVEIIEIPDHPWFLACQFHPEFQSRPLFPHPVFAGFVGVALEYGRKKAPVKTNAQ
ncbi:MAG: CTP synthase [bacterium]